MSDLFEHQKKIIADDLKKCGLFLGTGSGKTRTALLLARGLTLVIAPKTQRQDQNWEREFTILQKENLHVHAHQGNYAIQKTVLFTISKEMFRRDWEKLPHYDTVIVDEAHTCLGVTPTTRQRKKVTIPKASQLYEALEGYVKKHEPKRLYLCTATIMRSPMTVWGAATILGREWDFFQFRHDFYTRLPIPHREIWVPKNDDKTKDKLAALVRKIGYVGRLEDFFDVPEQTFKTEYIGLNVAQETRIRRLRLQYPEPIVRIGKIHQVENGVLAGDEYNEPEVFDSRKIDKILEYAVEFPRMVVFAKYTQQIRQISYRCERQKIPHLTLTGDMGDRGALIKRANEMPACVFIAQAQISAGWELPEYPVMIFASQTYSYVDRVQAEGRILRANHLKKNLYISLVVKGGVDEAIHKAIINKKDFDERLFVDV